MPFIPDSVFGIIYALLCFGTAGLSFTRMNVHARIVSLVFIIHWVAMRAIDVTDHANPWLWVPHSMAAVIALGLYGKHTQSQLAFACAILMAVCMTFDQFWLVQHVTGVRFDTLNGGFEQNAAVAEVIGYLCFAMIAGSAIGHSGMGSSTTIRGGMDRSRHLPARQGVQVGRAIFSRSGMPGDGMARHQDQEKENGGAR